MPIATRGGRKRWCIENQGFNIQKNSELRLEQRPAGFLQRKSRLRELLEPQMRRQKCGNPNQV